MSMWDFIEKHQLWTTLVGLGALYMVCDTLQTMVTVWKRKP